MDDLDARYDELAAADTDVNLPPHLEQAMLSRAGRRLDDTDAKVRHKALQVVLSVGGPATIPLLGRLSHDEEPEIRQKAVEAGQKMGPAGLPILRRAAESPYGALVASVLEQLAKASDAATTSIARRQLRAEDPRVRKAAAVFLGRLAGAAVQRELAPLCDDPDRTVAQAATEAMEQIRARRGGDAPSREASRRQAPAQADEGQELLRAFGEEKPKKVVRTKLTDMEPVQLAATVRRAAEAGEPKAARGAARLTRELAQASWVTPMRRLLRHADPSVRSAAIEALGAAGQGRAVVGDATRGLSDPEVEVRAAAIRALARLGSRLDLRDLARQHLAALKDDEAKEVQQARDEALAELETT